MWSVVEGQKVEGQKASVDLYSLLGVQSVADMVRHRSGFVLLYNVQSSRGSKCC